MAKTKVGESKTLQSIAEANKPKSTDDLLLAQAHGTLEIALVTEDEIAMLATDIAADKIAMEILKKRVEVGKAIILEWLKRRKQKEFHSAAGGSVQIGSSSSLEVLASKLLAYLKKVGKMNMVDTVLKVKLTEAKKYFGEDVIEKIGKRETEEYSSVRIG